MTDLHQVVRRAAADTVPPPFETLTRRAEVRRRQRAAGSVAAAAAVAVVAGGIALAHPNGDAHPAPVASGGPSTSAGTKPTGKATPTPTTHYGLTADSVVAKGRLYNYAVDRAGDLFANWSYCLDQTRCAAAWRLLRADGSVSTGLFPGDFAPHVDAGPDYFVGKWYADPGILVRPDGSTTPLRQESSGGVAPGAAMVVSEDGSMLVDGRAGAYLRVPVPGRGQWDRLAVGDDRLVWGTVVHDEGASAIAWSAGAGSWQQHLLADDGEHGDDGATLTIAGRRVAAYALKTRGREPLGTVVGASFTADDGAHWHDIDPAGLPFDHLESVAASADGTLFVNDGQQVFASTDWTNFTPVPGATTLSRLEGGDAAHPDTVYGYSYDRDELDAVTTGGVTKAERQLR